MSRAMNREVFFGSCWLLPVVEPWSRWCRMNTHQATPLKMPLSGLYPKMAVFELLSLTTKELYYNSASMHVSLFMVPSVPLAKSKCST